MVKCIDCEFCMKMISDADGRKFFACDRKYAELLKKNCPEYWRLQGKNVQVLEKMVEIQPFEDRECSDYEKKNLGESKENFKKKPKATLRIDKTEFQFRSRRGLEDLTAEFIEVVRKYQDSIRAALRDMENTPKKLDVVLTHKIEGVLGRFRIAHTIVLNAESFTELKQNCIDMETAHYEMMHTFLHELAHWITKDDAEAEELASEWMTATG